MRIYEAFPLAPGPRCLQAGLRWHRATAAPTCGGPRLPPKQACAAIARLVSMQETIEEEGFKKYLLFHRISF